MSAVFAFTGFKVEPDQSLMSSFIRERACARLLVIWARLRRTQPGWRLPATHAGPSRSAASHLTRLKRESNLKAAGTRPSLLTPLLQNQSSTRSKRSVPRGSESILMFDIPAEPCRTLQNPAEPGRTRQNQAEPHNLLLTEAEQQKQSGASTPLI